MRSQRKTTVSPRRQAQDHLDTIGQIVQLVWARKLWWAVPLLVSLAGLGVLLVIQATPIGPLLYPVF